MKFLIAEESGRACIVEATEIEGRIDGGTFGKLKIEGYVKLGAGLVSEAREILAKSPICIEDKSPERQIASLQAFSHTPMLLEIKKRAEAIQALANDQKWTSTRQAKIHMHAALILEALENIKQQ